MGQVLKSKKEGLLGWYGFREKKGKKAPRVTGEQCRRNSKDTNVQKKRTFKQEKIKNFSTKKGGHNL